MGVANALQTSDNQAAQGQFQRPTSTFIVEFGESMQFTALHPH